MKVEGLRAWVAGCSTGEEAYSVAITLLERAEHGAQVLVFATDLRPGCLARARQGRYPVAALAAVPAELREKYFVREGSTCRVRRHLRDAVCFGEHDLLRHPPFGKLHLISCRNVLLYLQTSAQHYVLHRLHYGLLPEGALFLGLAESPAAAPGLFRTRDRQHRVYGKLSAPSGTSRNA